MNAKKINDQGGQRTFALVFDTDEEVMQGLTAFAKDNALTAASLTAVGAFGSTTLGFFDMRRKEYEKIPVNEQAEALSLVGDIAPKEDGDPQAHVHAVLGLSDGTTRGGHLIEAYVRPTLEVVIDESPGHAVHSADRLTHPLRRTSGGDLARVSQDEALDELSERLRTDREKLGTNGVGLYISGQLLTEDYYAVNKLARGALGTNNLESNSRLCMSSAVAGYAGAFGTDGPPASYADITHAECFLLVGTNTAECHPITFGRIKERKKATEVAFIVADPRKTPTAEIADLHLPIRPGTDIALLNAMLRTMISERLIDEEYIRRHTSHFEETASSVRE